MRIAAWMDGRVGRELLILLPLVVIALAVLLVRSRRKRGPPR